MRVLAVPVKPLGRSKSRLAAVLSPPERAVLTLALLEDVLEAALEQDPWQVWVVCADEAVLELAVRRGARAVVEEGRSLLAATRQMEAEAETAGAEALAVLLADLPYVTPPDLRGGLMAEAAVVAAPAASDGGTNLLVRRPPSVIPARFGRASFAKHRWAARRAGVPFHTVSAPGLALDLDAPADLLRLVRSGQRSRAQRACLEMGVAGRLLSA